MTISDLTLKQLRSYSVIKECLQMQEHNFKRGVLVFNLKVQKTLPVKRVLETSHNLSSQEKYLPPSIWHNSGERRSVPPPLLWFEVSCSDIHVEDMPLRGRVLRGGG